MKISSWEEKVKHLLTLPETYHWPVKRYNEKKEEIDVIYKNYPFIVTVEADWEDFAEKDVLAWKLFGPEDGKCNYYIDDYHCPCPLVLEAKNKMIQEGKDPYEYDSETPEHSHNGCWKQAHIAKTGYDYGFGSYCFKNEEDKIKFIKEIVGGN